MPNVIATLNDSVNVSPISWRQGSLTQRVADLALGGGGASPAGSQVASTGIVRGFEVYPDAAVSQKVNLLVAEGTMDSLVVFTDSTLEMSLQYRTFGTVEVVFTVVGNRYLGFRPDFTNRVIELVDYSEAEYNSGVFTSQNALLIAVVNVPAGLVLRTGIRYAGQTSTGNSWIRNQIFNPDLVERYVLDFSDDLPIPYEVTGAGSATITSGSLVITGTNATSTLAFPIFQYMASSFRDGFIDVSCKIRAIITYQSAALSSQCTAYFRLSTGSTSSGVDYPYGNPSLRFNTAAQTTVEIIPAPAPSRPDWGSLEIDFNAVSGNLTIYSIVFELDRVWRPIPTQNLILGSQSYQSSSPNFYTTISSVGLRVADTTPPDARVSLVYNTGVDVSEGTAKLARITSSGIGIYDNVNPFSAVDLVELTPTSVVVRDRAPTPDDSVSISSTQVELESGNFLGTLEAGQIKVENSSPIQSVTMTWENIESERSTYSSIFGDISLTSAPANSFGIHATDGTSTTYLYQDGIVCGSGFNLTLIGPLGITTTGANGYSGINAPKLLAKVTWDGTNWSITSSYCVVPGAPLGFSGATNNNSQFTLIKAGATFTYSFGNTEKAGDLIATAPSGSTTINVYTPSTPSSADSVYILAF